MGLWTEKAMELRPIVEKAMSFSSDLTDEEIKTAASMFPEWAAGLNYIPGMKIKRNDVLYNVLQVHTSQIGWEPENAPSLFAKVLTDPSGAPQVWQQPDSTNPYMIGDRVLYPDETGLVYESLIDNNTWSPEAYPQGWRLVE